MHPLISSLQGAELIVPAALVLLVVALVLWGRRRIARAAVRDAMRTHQRLNQCPTCGHGEEGPL